MFTGKVIIVTGAAGNVGSALAMHLASKGARIAAVDTVKDRLEAVIAGLPGSGHMALSTYDLTDSAATAALVAQIVTTVGGFAMAKLADAGLDQWDKMFSLNVKTTWNIYRAAVPAIKQAGGGALIGIGSAAGLRGSGEMAAYAATKSAVMRLTESFADELRTDNIRVNAVLPTTIDTPQNHADMPGADSSRWVKPAAIAEVMGFLLSDAARAVSGQLLQVGF
jgi:NAD(P)-dependent dehydrogenase (short-subunit alcohol dehydrogenase family)